jgi:hypothetical protein
MMRDHRLAFLEPRIFFRWRSNHVVHFEFSRASIVDQPIPEAFLIKPGSAGTFLFSDSVVLKIIPLILIQKSFLGRSNKRPILDGMSLFWTEKRGYV